MCDAPTDEKEPARLAHDSQDQEEDGKMSRDKRKRRHFSVPERKNINIWEKNKKPENENLLLDFVFQGCQ